MVDTISTRHPVTILIAYATRYDSTREVAEHVAVTLREYQFTVDVQPARDVRSLEGYGAVVLGAPLYLGHWHKEAHRFLDQHRVALLDRPVAVFALGPVTNPLDDTEWQGAREMLDMELSKSAWLAPVQTALFGGTLDPSRFGLRDRLLAGLPASPLHNLPASDLRDWNAIREWAGHLAATLRAPQSSEGQR
jgi:menaquinone-dependent protoporphyrinogen oxidase